MKPYLPNFCKPTESKNEKQAKKLSSLAANFSENINTYGSKSINLERLYALNQN